MNKQQLANKIWASANKMRSKIEANEYKDYILGFMFYKFLSDKEQRFLEANDFTSADIKALTEEDPETVEFIKNGIGYFIAYDNLFSTWLEKASLCSTCTKQKFKIGGINRLFSLIQLIRPLPHNLTVVILVFYHNPIFL